MRKGVRVGVYSYTDLVFTGPVGDVRLFEKVSRGDNTPSNCFNRGYGFNCDWGRKWGFCNLDVDIDFVSDGKKYADRLYSFEDGRTLPPQILAIISKEFPTLTFLLRRTLEEGGETSNFWFRQGTGAEMDVSLCSCCKGIDSKSSCWFQLYGSKETVEECGLRPRKAREMGTALASRCMDCARCLSEAAELSCTVYPSLIPKRYLTGKDASKGCGRFLKRVWPEPTAAQRARWDVVKAGDLDALPGWIGR